MSFAARTGQAAAMEASLDDIVWNEAHRNRRASLVKTGYEHRYNQEEQDLMKPILEGAVLFVRYVPDRLVVTYAEGQPARPLTAWFMEYKTMMSPILTDFQFGKICQSARGLGCPSALLDSMRKTDIGTVETAGWLVYRALQERGARVALVAYCGYYAPHLLCEYVENIRLLYSVDFVAHGKGSNTPYTNLDLRSFRSMSAFMHTEVGGPTDWQTTCQKASDAIHGRTV